ncbi:hypothetical protein [Endozoicomonas sp. 4G]|nr:hypothetical protein [Endozoicomonas sp. 4G]
MPASDVVGCPDQNAGASDDRVFHCHGRVVGIGRKKLESVGWM